MKRCGRLKNFKHHHLFPFPFLSAPRAFFFESDTEAPTPPPPARFAQPQQIFLVNMEAERAVEVRWLSRFHRTEDLGESRSCRSSHRFMASPSESCALPPSNVILTSWIRSNPVSAPLRRDRPIPRVLSRSVGARADEVGCHQRSRSPWGMRMRAPGPRIF
jgi:hypothetical protein